MKLLVAVLLAFSLQAAHAAGCSYDHARMMKADYVTFSDALRGLDQKACLPQIRDLLHDYREGRKKDLTAGQYRLLTWQEGTARAKMGDNFTAIPLLSAWLDDPSPAIRDYAAATIAFLNRDKPGLLAARDKLVAEPQPPGFDEQAIGQKWPLNLVIVDAFVGCWDRSYAEAYESDECTTLGEKARQ